MDSLLNFLAGYTHVTTGLSLLAFVVAGGIIALRYRHAQRLAAIQKATGADAARLVDGTLTALNLNTETLSDVHRFELAKRELDRIAKRQLIAAGLVAFIAVLLAVLSYLAMRRDDVAYTRLIDTFVAKDLRTGTPAARKAAVNSIKERGPEFVEITNRKLADELLSAQGVELCNLMLASFDLNRGSRISDILAKSKKSVEHQLHFPACTQQEGPDFSDKKFDKLAFVGPNFLKVNFIRATFNEVPFEAGPDYTGRDQTDCKINDTEFNGAKIENSAFTGCGLSTVSFNNSEFNAVNFHRSNLTRVDFRFSTLRGVRFLASKLTHVDLRDAKEVGGLVFGFQSTIGHLRGDFKSLRSVGTLPIVGVKIFCISQAEASDCWDNVSADKSECPKYSGSGIFAVTKSEEEQRECDAWSQTA